MVKAGFAAYTPYNNDNKEKYQNASEYAKNNKLGIYNETYTQTKNTNNPECFIKGNVSDNEKTKIYHLPNCSDYENLIIDLWKGDQWFCSETEAQKAGFVKSKNCW